MMGFRSGSGWCPVVIALRGIALGACAGDEPTASASVATSPAGASATAPSGVAGLASSHAGISPSPTARWKVVEAIRASVASFR
jgi:hypothetical protein